MVAAEAALSRKALDVRLLDLRGIASFTDYFVICSGTSDTHIEGIADAVREAMDEAGERLWHREGPRKSEWVLLDYVDVVVHVFTRSAREQYDLERLWSEARMVPIDDVDVEVDSEWEEFVPDDEEFTAAASLDDLVDEDDEWDMSDE